MLNCKTLSKIIEDNLEDGLCHVPTMNEDPAIGPTIYPNGIDHCNIISSLMYLSNDNCDALSDHFIKVDYHSCHLMIFTLNDCL